MSSFRKISTQSIRGTQTSLQNGQTITSCGNPSLNQILGGGIPIGSILLIEEDKFVTYSKVLAKYFLAEGVYSEHSIFFGSLDDDVNELIKKLPKPVEDCSSNLNNGGDRQEINCDNQLLNKNNDDEMRIAWRYQNLPKVNSEQLSSGNIKYGRNFNLLEKIDENTIENSDITLWNNNDENNFIKNLEQNIFENSIYYDFLEKLSNVIKCKKFSLKELSSSSSSSTADVADKNILRVCITSLGSPLWYNENFIMDFLKFLQILKSIIRNHLSICFLTIPMHLFEILNANFPNRVRNLCDYSIELKSFSGTDKETNPTFKDYNGLLNIKRLTALNSLMLFSPETTDLAFKLRRKRFVIEKLHLPPEIEENDNQNQEMSSLSCTSNQKNLLEF